MCPATAFSRILEIKGRIDMGKKLSRLQGSVQGFLRIGVIATILKSDGTMPALREV